MIVYISGPMTGRPNYNFPAFHAAAFMMRGLGHGVRNPADTALQDGYEYGDYLRAALRMQLDCDAIYLLDGWEESRGARLERAVADALGQTVMHQTPSEEDDHG